MFTLLSPKQNVRVIACVVLYDSERDEYRLLSDVGNNWRLSTPIVKGECVDNVFRVQTTSGSTYDINHGDIKQTEYLDGLLLLLNGRSSNTVTIFASTPKSLIQLIDSLG